MRKKAMQFVLLLILLVVSSATFSQAPAQFNFQGVARNINGKVIVAKAIALRFSIRTGGASGPVSYREQRSSLTDSNGVFNAVIGGAGVTNTTGLLDTVSWAIGPRFLQVEMDTANGINFINLGATQLLNVPYSMFSNNSLRASYADYTGYADSARSTAFAMSARSSDSSKYAKSAHSSDSSKYASTAHSSDSSKYAKSARSSDSSQYASTARYSDSSKYAKSAHSSDSSNYSRTADSSQYANSSNFAFSTLYTGYADSARSAAYAKSAYSSDSSKYSKIADSSKYTRVADSSQYARNADSSQYARVADSSKYTRIADSSKYATSSGSYFFEAVGSSSSAGTVKFSSTNYNTLNPATNMPVYNTTTGVFTAPVTGIYQFDALLFAQDCDNLCDIPEEFFLLVNGTKKRILSKNVADNDDTYFQLQCTIWLSQNDTVLINAADNAAASGTFSGFKIK